METSSAFADGGRSPQTHRAARVLTGWDTQPGGLPGPSAPTVQSFPDFIFLETMLEDLVMFSSFGAVWKVEVVVGLVAVLGMCGALPCCIDPSASVQQSFSFGAILLQRHFLNFRPQEAMDSCILWWCGIGAWKISLCTWERWWDGHAMALSLIHGMNVARCSWVSAHFYIVSGSSKIPWTFCSLPLTFLFSKKALTVSEFCCFI